jgi:2-haloalkanoic acid dehalogenase type II
MTRNLRDFEALTFDCYGTLIDWESGIWDAFQPVLAANQRNDVTRALALSTFAQLETEQKSATPGLLYAELLSRVHAILAEALDLESTKELDTDFGNSVPHWPAFADTADALRYLKTRYKLVILSNVHREGLAASNRKLGVSFDAIYTAEDIGAYKPSPANFEYMLSHLQEEHGIEKSKILHTAQSLFHDHVPAKACGLANAWIDRQGLSQGGSWGATAEVRERPQTDFVFASMEEMAEAVKVDSRS